MKLKNKLFKQANKPTEVEKFLNLFSISVQNTMVKDSYEEMALFHLTANNPLQHKDMAGVQGRNLEVETNETMEQHLLLACSLYLT